MSSHDHRTLIDIGKNLLEGLTSEEVMLLLGALLETMPSEWHEKALMPLSEDTKLTIQNIVMQPVVDAKPVKSTSIAKLEEVWATLWKDWDRVVREGMDDEGKYMVWENRWEPSYFEEFSFVIDLEAIAEKMLPLIDTAIAYQFSPKADFIDALSDAEQDVENHLPDSIEFGDGLALGKPLTTCLLKAEWLLAEQRGIGAFGFVLKIKESEEEFRNTSLNTDTFLTFFSKLTEADQRVIFDGFDRHRNEEIWQDLQDPSSMWHTLYINYLNRYAPERYIDVLRETIPQKWQNGLPIIKDLLAKKSYKTGFDVAQETLDSMLRGQHRVSDWTPQKSLYFGHLSWQYSYNPDNFESERRLFVYYEKAAREVGQTDLANILAIQVLAFDKFFNWEAMLKGLREKPLPDSVYQTFLTFWVECLTESAKPSSYWRSHRDGSQAPDSWWVTWLFESIIDTQKGKVWFQQKMSHWLTNLSLNHQAAMSYLGVLRLLTEDLDAMSGSIKRQYPMFHRVVIKSSSTLAKDSTSRRVYLQRYCSPNLIEEVMTCWKRSLRFMVPSPKSTKKGDYSNHVNWMGALQELDVLEYNLLLSEWRKTHGRRRNLWRDMRKAGLG